MPQFAVTIRRTEYREHTFVVEADSPEQAEEDIYELPDGPLDYNWNDASKHTFSIVRSTPAIG